MTTGNAGEPSELQIVVPPSQQGGVWANFAIVSHTEHEFTLDFVRTDPVSPARGIVVARVSVSPLMITQLLNSLQENWAAYAEKALPKEVYNDGGSPADGGEPGTEG